MKDNVILKVYKYFLPSAWRRYKGYFVIRFLRLIVNTITPFIPIVFMPQIVDELVGSRDVKRITTYVLVILITEYVLNNLNGLFGNVLERYSQKFENYYAALMSARIMELDFQLTEDKKALDQIELAKNGMSWYSGGLNGIVEPLFNMATALLTVAGVVVIIAGQAPLILLITLVLLVLSAVINKKMNQMEQEQYVKLSKINRVFGYMGWELTDFRYGKDIRLYGAKDMMVNKWRDYSSQECC